MSRSHFEMIKSKLKYSKAKDKDPQDKAWRVRALLKLFQKNILKFGFWKSALSVDEMMAKSYARTCLKQFIRGKPTRFGLKFWGLCVANGYLFNKDLYCGKNSVIGDKLSKCALGSRVVLHLLKPFFELTSDAKIPLYHLYFDNYFTNLDLVVHLNRLKLKCTGTVRDNRVPVKNVIHKKAPRGTYAVKHEKNSGINYITVMDSKPVLILSTAAGITPLSSAKRYSSIDKEKVDIPVPQAFHLYN
ncbi:piggyBac transposable element-derived protein 3-like [Phymastichus coffea]|uniref:piggyBac transposable element-derived protein 3-like n=1 Tax=Phymastichus coffea TaxID=108790 RepID=UPI00273C2325|nr:piggyBac transposable element-derived protein 3-like [Phymastichus coffea]